MILEKVNLSDFRSLPLIEKNKCVALLDNEKLIFEIIQIGTHRHFKTHPYH